MNEINTTPDSASVEARGDGERGWRARDASLICGVFQIIAGVAGLLLAIDSVKLYGVSPITLLVVALMLTTMIAGASVLFRKPQGRWLTLIAQGFVSVAYVFHGHLYQIALGPYFRIVINGWFGFAIEWGSSVGWRIAPAADTNQAAVAINLVPFALMALAWNATKSDRVRLSA